MATGVQGAAGCQVGGGQRDTQALDKETPQLSNPAPNAHRRVRLWTLVMLHTRHTDGTRMAHGRPPDADLLFWPHFSVEAEGPRVRNALPRDTEGESRFPGSTWPCFQHLSQGATNQLGAMREAVGKPHFSLQLGNLRGNGRQEAGAEEEVGRGWAVTFASFSCSPL